MEADASFPLAAQVTCDRAADQALEASTRVMASIRSENAHIIPADPGSILREKEDLLQ